MNNIDLRDHFAGLAMQGLAGRLVEKGLGDGYEDNNEKLAHVAYILADTMIEVRGECDREDEELFIPTQDFRLDK